MEKLKKTVLTGLISLSFLANPSFANEQEEVSRLEQEIVSSQLSQFKAKQSREYIDYTLDNIVLSGNKTGTINIVYDRVNQKYSNLSLSIAQKIKGREKTTEVYSDFDFNGLNREGRDRYSKFNDNCFCIPRENLLERPYISVNQLNLQFGDYLKQTLTQLKK